MIPPRRPAWPNQTCSPSTCRANPRTFFEGAAAARLVLRPVRAQDVEGLAGLVAQRESTPTAEVRERYRRELRAPAAENRLLLVAAHMRR